MNNDFAKAVVGAKQENMERQLRLFALARPHLETLYACLLSVAPDIRTDRPLRTAASMLSQYSSFMYDTSTDKEILDWTRTVYRSLYWLNNMGYQGTDGDYGYSPKQAIRWDERITWKVLPFSLTPEEDARRRNLILELDILRMATMLLSGCADADDILNFNRGKPAGAFDKALWAGSFVDHFPERRPAAAAASVARLQARQP